MEARLDKHIVLPPCLTTSLVVRGNRTTLPCTQKSLQASLANVLQFHRRAFAAAANSVNNVVTNICPTSMETLFMLM